MLGNKGRKFLASRQHAAKGGALLIHRWGLPLGTCWPADGKKKNFRKEGFWRDKKIRKWTEVARSFRGGTTLILKTATERQRGV